MSSTMLSTNSVLSLLGFVSSNRTSSLPSYLSAKCWFSSAALAWPMCKYPDGSGGNRVYNGALLGVGQVDGEHTGRGRRRRCRSTRPRWPHSRTWRSRPARRQRQFLQASHVVQLNCTIELGFKRYTARR